MCHYENSTKPAAGEDRILVNHCEWKFKGPGFKTLTKVSDSMNWFNRHSITPLKDYYREDDIRLDHSRIKAALRLSSKDSDIAAVAKELRPGPLFDTQPSINEFTL
ncbi:hypothetical protein NW752_007654 [Fusarium irregulare]|nr:hypothetical protein NW752_007654 [Fusarium irregulare]